MLQKHRGSGLTALDAQIEGAAAGLREIGARLEAIKATATTIHRDASRAGGAKADTQSSQRAR